MESEGIDWADHSDWEVGRIIGRNESETEARSSRAKRCPVLRVTQELHEDGTDFRHAYHPKARVCTLGLIKFSA